MDDGHISKVFEVLHEEVKRFKVPAVTEISRVSRDPFKVLVSCVLSLRTKDDVTGEASRRLFKLAGSPREIAALPVRMIEKAIYPVGFYRNKAASIKDICKTLVEGYGSKVPDSIEELLRLKGVGRKTANLVVTIGYGKPGICVDTHVHRITNRWGYVSTPYPLRTETALREKLPKRYWIVINDLLVTFGQNICKPVSPLCSRCRIAAYCGRVGVLRSR